MNNKTKGEFVLVDDLTTTGVYSGRYQSKQFIYPKSITCFLSHNKPTNMVLYKLPQLEKVIIDERSKDNKIILRTCYNASDVEELQYTDDYKGEFRIKPDALPKYKEIIVNRSETNLPSKFDLLNRKDIAYIVLLATVFICIATLIYL